MEPLSATEQAILEAQIDPDAPSSNQDEIKWEKETIYTLIGTMSHNKEFLARAIRLGLEPKYLNGEGPRRIISILFRLYKAHQKLPEPWQVEEEIVQLANQLDEDANPERQARHLREMRGCYHTCHENYHTIHGVDYLNALLVKAIQRIRAKANIFNALEGMKKGKWNPADYAKEATEIANLQLDTEYVVKNATDYFAYASQLEDTWVIENWLPKGTITLFSAEPKAGKSTLTFSIVPSVIAGEKWFDSINTVQSHVVLLDYENPPQYVANNLLEYRERDQWPTVSDNLHIPSQLPTGLTAEWIEDCIRNRCGLTEEDNVLIVIDSARRAFSALFPKVPNWENSASEVGKAVNPLHALAHRTGWSILLVHHDNKSGGVSGSADWRGSVDFVWRYAIKSEQLRHLSIEGRLLDSPNALAIRKQGRKVVLSGTAYDDATSTDTTTTNGLLSVIPVATLAQVQDGESGITMSEIIEKFQGVGWSEKTIRNRVSLLVQDGKLGKLTKGQGAASRGYYYRDELLV